MRNPIHKRLENLESWQHLTFMACLCERMAPNFALFCQMTEQKPADKTYHNILNLVWEFLTVKEAKINFENQLEKLEEIIPDVNDYDFFGVVPALDACEALGELLHAIIAGETLEKAIQISQISLGTVCSLLETQENRDLSESELKSREEIEEELDLQWQIYRLLKDCEKRDVDLILSLRNEIKQEGISNIGIKIAQNIVAAHGMAQKQAVGKRERFAGKLADQRIRADLHHQRVQHINKYRFPINRIPRSIL